MAGKSSVTLEIFQVELLRFFHQIPSFRLTEERGGSLRGFRELCAAALRFVPFELAEWFSYHSPIRRRKWLALLLFNLVPSETHRFFRARLISLVNCMGSVGNEGDEINQVNRNSSISIADTVPEDYDSQFSPSLPAETNDEIGDDLQSLKSVMPYDDTVQVNDVFETQLVDIGDETHLMNLDDKTQVTHIDDDTQVWDEYDVIEHVDTQLLDDFDNEVVDDVDGENTDMTAVLSDTEGSVDTKSKKSSGDQTLGNEEVQSAAFCHQDDNGLLTTKAVPSADAPCNSGKCIMKTQLAGKHGGCPAGPEWAPLSASIQITLDDLLLGLREEELLSFMQLHYGLLVRQLVIWLPRVLRLGLVLIYAAFKLPNYVLPWMRGFYVEVANQKQDVVKNNEKSNGVRFENKIRLGTKTASKLFMEEVNADEEEPNCNINVVDGEADYPELRCRDNELAGLSYTDSQEPGELSQANALDFVERFLKVNVFDFDQDINHETAASEKPKSELKRKKPGPASITKGTRSLAKKADCTRTFVGTGIFNWDDGHEDGGREFFHKKKDVVFGAGFCEQKSCTEPRKPQHCDLKGGRSLEKSSNCEQPLKILDKMMGLVHSGSKLVLHDTRKTDHCEGLNIKTNLNKDLDEQISVERAPKRVEVVTVSPEIPDMLDVGVDTQMAAEAMEVLAKGADFASNPYYSSHQHNHSWKGTRKKQATKRGDSKQGFLNRVCPSGSGVTTRSKRANEIGVKSGEELKSSVLVTRSCKIRTQVDIDLSYAKAKRSKLNMENISNKNAKEAAEKKELKNYEEVKEGTLEGKLEKNGCEPAKTNCLHGKVGTFEPIAWRTRKHMVGSHLNGAGDTFSDSRAQVHNLREVCAAREETKSNSKGWDASEVFNAKDNASKQARVTDGTNVDGSSSLGLNLENMSDQVNRNGKLEGLPGACIGHEPVGNYVPRRKRSERNVQKPVLSGKGFNFRWMTLLTLHGRPIFSSTKSHACSSPLAEASVVGLASDVSPGDVGKSSNETYTTLVQCRTPANAASPVCVGNEYYKQSCKKNLSRSSLTKELDSLAAIGTECTSAYKYLRKRRDMSNTQVLFSCHLDEDVTRQQKKILGRLGASLASSVSEATHFVTDKFVRTRNMLLAIAGGKQVVTPLWLENCGQASCWIDEKNYILRDAKKEKEFGFSMPVTLARASQYPLLKDRRVLITTSTKPGTEIISSLVRAVHGQVVEKMCRSLLNDDKLPDDLLILSCEEDYEVCMPLLEKGAAIYTSELLLHGIVTQKLEYERHRLFVDHVKRTRSTIRT
ncbi:hypothetical protein Nepgr_021873 [Nepenthes gracilis]|uniref:BRCT domain-containing protein n=1 Tax=Nepenthes gracilis TaxID=150966 RepID=A0AAD3SZQ0_NEPGR|nr:hypothetical protein Nepgr_021873 [Nepenthes gracilis]